MTNPTPHFVVQSNYQSLSDHFFQKVKPTPVRLPELIIFNHDLASEIGFPFNLEQRNALTQYLSGNKIFEGSSPIAQAYAGHQFGNFTMLGDGRAILLGEIQNKNSELFDIQLKGSGKTPYSRGGDGRATVSAMLREYLISESMFALGIPTTRSLAVIKTGETVYREETQDGAVLTRTAKSHIRVGTFEYAYQFLSEEDLTNFVQYTIDRHYPELNHEADKTMSLLRSVMIGQIHLVVDWMRVGFIHGVMNTDNMSITCETIDYGPCAFMNSYDPNTVFSSIDKQGRYAYGNQPGIVHWNLACFANSLLPLINKNEDTAVKLAQECLDTFPGLFEETYWSMLGKKIGFTEIDSDVKNLIQELLRWMKQNKADYTNTFLTLEQDHKINAEIYQLESFLIWKKNWETLVKKKGIKPETLSETLKKTNPIRIPRNHKVEFVLAEAKKGNFSEFLSFVKTLKNPYERDDKFDPNKELPQEDQSNYRTFCGT
ncbi:YdiU family protein [Leptospira sp. 96542]|nr:YdiU family protein [Leptospira sp. 96542]